MDSSNDFSSKLNKMYKTPWNVEKNYSPSKQVGTTLTDAIHRRRVASVQRLHAIKEEQSLELQVEALTALASSKPVEGRRTHNRLGFQKRDERRQSQYTKYIAVPRDISPWLNCFNHQGMSFESRLAMYNRRHKCAHGRCYTMYQLFQSVRTDGSTVPVYIEPKCHCHSELITPRVVNHMCGNCTNCNLRQVSDPTFPGDIVHCTYCKNTQYRIIGWSRIRPLIDVVSSMPANATTSSVVSERTYAQAINAKKEMGENVIGVVRGLFTKITDFFTGVKDWIVSLVGKSIKDMLIDTLLKAFQELLNVFAKHPLSLIYHMYKFLHSESHLERMFILAILLEDAAVGNILYRIAFALGFDDWIPVYKREVYEKQVRDASPDVQQKDHKRIQKQAAADTASKFDAIRIINPHFDEHGFPINAKKEVGSYSILDRLFGLSKLGMATSTVLELVKDFNTSCTGWKNIHELVSQWADKLPSWLLKVFTASDPRKRYGIESKRPGTPIYIMVQAYLALLEGTNCASSEAYRAFDTAWKAADQYIMREYPVNQQVIDTNRRFWINAHAIMTPGTLGSKPIPFVVTLFGAPGTGKSSTWPVLLSGIVKGTFDEVAKAAYTRNSSSDFFDGYQPSVHKVFLYDDFGHRVDDECAGELMSIVSTADYLPPYASINDPNIGVKGTSFNSPIVVLCSNFETFNQCKQIADKTALARRLGIVIEWQSRLENMDEENYLVFRVDEMGRKIPITRAVANKADHNRYSARQIQKLLKHEYLVHMESQTRIKEHFNKWMVPEGDCIDDFVAKYESVRAKKADAAVDAVKQGGVAILRGFGYWGIITLAYALADKLDEKQSSLYNVALALAAGVAAVFLAYKLFFSFDKATSESGETVTRQANRVPQFARANHSTAAKQEIGDANDDGVIKKITHNHVVLVDEQNRYVNGLFVCGTVLLTVKHFAMDIKKLFTVHTHRSCEQAVFDVDISDCKVIPFADTDLAYIVLPNFVQPFPNLLRYTSEQPLSRRGKGYTTRRTLNNDLLVYEVDYRPGSTALRFHTGTEREYTTICDITYEFRHKDGDCGNVILAKVGSNLTLIGMHESGSVSNANISFATMLNRGELEHYLKDVPKRAIISRQMDFPCEEAIRENGVGVNKTMFVAVSSQHIMSSGKTTLQPSLVHDLVHEHTTEPAILRRQGELDPMRDGLAKYGLSTAQFPQDAVDTAIHSLTEELMSLRTDEDLTRELTMNEILNGGGGIESVDSTTSSGYPFSLDPKLRGAKRALLEGQAGEWELGVEAERDYQRWADVMRQGEVPSDPWLATLKDERRKIEKVKAGKTRVFCAGSLSGFLHNKRLFGGFCLFLKRIRGRTFSTLGLNRASLEWNEMLRYLKEVGENGLDGDQKEWDGRLKAAIAMALLYLFQIYYGKDDRTPEYWERYILFCHAIFPYIRITWVYGRQGPETVIIEVPGCMPSGWFLTFVLNSLVNAILFRVAWILIVSRPYNDLYYFRLYTREKYAGDDNWLSVVQAFLEEFNNVTIARLFAQYGQIYTPASKSGDLLPYQRLEDCTFLKTKTGLLFDRYVPLFDMDANLDTLNWIRKCNDEFKATEDNCNDVLRNLFFFGDATFTEYRNKILSVQPCFNLINYYSLKLAYLGDGVIPDPYGSFGFTKSNPTSVTVKRSAQNRNPALRATASTQFEDAVKESGIYDNMNMVTGHIPIYRTLNEQEVRRLPSHVRSMHNEVEQLTAKRDALSKRINDIHQKMAKHINTMHAEAAQPEQGLEFRVIAALMDYIDAKKEAGVFSKIGRDLGGALDDVVESVIPAEVTGAVAGILLDKPAITEFPPPLVRKDAQYMSASRGVENLERMTLEPSAQYLTADQFNDSTDEMDMEYLLKKPVYLTTFNWSATQDVGTILFQCITSPAHLTNPITIGSAFQPTILGYLADKFTYWRGGLKVTFMIVSTAFHEGRIGTTNHPGTTTAPSDYPTGLSQYANSQTVRNTNNTIEVIIPFHSDIPWKKVWHGETLSDTLTDSAVRSTDYVIGCMALRVDVPLKSPNNVANNVDVNVFVSAADDFEFHTLSPWGGLFVTYDGGSFERLKKHRAQRAKRARCLKIENAKKESGSLDAPDDGFVQKFDAPESEDESVASADSVPQLLCTQCKDEDCQCDVDSELDDASSEESDQEIDWKNEPRQYMSDEHAAEMAAYLIRSLKAGFVDTAVKQAGTTTKDGLTVEQPVASQTNTQATTQGTESNLDVANPQVSSQQGVHLSEQQETVITKPVDGNTNSSISRAQAHLNEPDWDLQKMLARYNLVGAFAWNLTDSAGTELTIVGTAPADCPTDLLQNAIVSAPFMRFQWWRCDFINVRFQMVASRFHQGRLGMFFVPSMVPKVQLSSVAPAYSPTRWTQLQHAFLDPSNGTVVEFQIPFRYHKGWIDLVFGDVLGQLRVQVLNQLQAATGASTSVEVKVFVSFTNSHFRVPRPGGDSFRQQLAKEALNLGYELIPINAKKQSGDLNTDTKDDQGYITLGIGRVKTYDPKIHHFGESYKSLREMCKRYMAQDAHYVATAVTDTPGTFLHYGFDYGGLLGQLFYAYRLFRGPLNFKIQMAAQSVNGTNKYDTKMTGFCTTNPNPALFSSGDLAEINRYLGPRQLPHINTSVLPPMVRFSTTQVGEFQIPYQSIYHSQICENEQDDVSEYYGNQYFQSEILYNIQNNFLGDTSKEAVVTLAVAFGDETRLGVFLGFPPQIGVSPAYPNPGS